MHVGTDSPLSAEHPVAEGSESEGSSEAEDENGGRRLPSTLPGGIGAYRLVRPATADRINADKIVAGKPGCCKREPAHRVVIGVTIGVARKTST